MTPIDKIRQILGVSPEAASSFLEHGVFFVNSQGEMQVGIGPFLPSPKQDSVSFYLPGYFAQAGHSPNLHSSYAVKTHLDELKLISNQDVPEPHWEEPSPQDFVKRVLAAQARFKTSELRKVLPVVRWRSSWKPNFEEKCSLFLKMLEFSKVNYKNGPAYTYGYWNGSKGFIGRTPELLFELEDRRLSTMALAGTAWPGKGHELLSDPKEQEEHQWVVREILSKLNPRGNFSTGTLQKLKAGNLEHLYTPIAGELNQLTSPENLAQDLHPTPALGGYPQALALEWLKEQPEAQWRGDFGGPFGVQIEGSRRFECVVLIRGLFWNENESFIPCGCGIVAASVPEREWVELAKKKDSVARMLGWNR